MDRGLYGRPWVRCHSGPRARRFRRPAASGDPKRARRGEGPASARFGSPSLQGDEIGALGRGGGEGGGAPGLLSISRTARVAFVVLRRQATRSVLGGAKAPPPRGFGSPSLQDDEIGALGRGGGEGGGAPGFLSISRTAHVAFVVLRRQATRSVLGGAKARLRAASGRLPCRTTKSARSPSVPLSPPCGVRLPRSVLGGARPRLRAASGRLPCRATKSARSVAVVVRVEGRPDSSPSPARSRRLARSAG